MKPKARRSDVLTQPVGDELVLYDQRSQTAHRLSPIAAALWRHCDGTRTIDELTACLGDAAAGAPDARAQAVHGLDMLAEADLLHDATRLRHRLYDRREALIAAAALLPMVTSILAPTPAHAQSSILPPPPPSFDKYNGNFEGRSVLIDSSFDGFSGQMQAFVFNDVGDQGTGGLDLETIPKTDYDLAARSYEVTIDRDTNTIVGEGSFTTAQGVEVTCSISGSFNSNCNRLRFMEVVIFDNHIGTATWEIIVRR